MGYQHPYTQERFQREMCHLLRVLGVKRSRRSSFLRRTRMDAFISRNTGASHPSLKTGLRGWRWWRISFARMSTTILRLHYRKQLGIFEALARRATTGGRMGPRSALDSYSRKENLSPNSPHLWNLELLESGGR